MKLRTFDIAPRKCVQCGELIHYKLGSSGQEWKNRKACSWKCLAEWRKGENHPRWKGGIKHRPDGYLRTKDDKYIHRLVMEEFLGRKLEKWEHVHHKDHNPKNNNIENLEVVNASEHGKYHSHLWWRKGNGQYAKKSIN